MSTNDAESGDSPQSYPFGIYQCTCGVLYIWYPDSKKDPEQDFFPESISCSCGGSARAKEKLRIKFDEIDEKLVPLFIHASTKYDFTQLLMIDGEHVHLFWNAPKDVPE